MCEVFSNKDSVIHTGETPEYVRIPDYAHLLPEAIQSFTIAGVCDAESSAFIIIQGSGYGGSYPHLAHEFLIALAEDREPFPNAPVCKYHLCRNPGSLICDAEREANDVAGIYIERFCLSVGIGDENKIKPRKYHLRGLFISYPELPLTLKKVWTIFLHLTF